MPHLPTVKYRIRCRCHTHILHSEILHEVELNDSDTGRELKVQLHTLLQVIECFGLNLVNIQLYCQPNCLSE